MWFYLCTRKTAYGILFNKMVQAKCTVNKLVAVGVVVTVVIYYAKTGVVEGFVMYISKIM